MTKLSRQESQGIRLPLNTSLNTIIREVPEAKVVKTAVSAAMYSVCNLYHDVDVDALHLTRYARA